MTRYPRSQVLALLGFYIGEIARPKSFDKYPAPVLIFPPKKPKGNGPGLRA